MRESRADFLSRRADEMRKDQTKAEKRIRTILNSEWQEQVPLCGNYIADFYHPAYKVVIEADGGYHTTSEQTARDRMRDAVMARDGILVIRFTNRQIISQSPWVAQTITRQLSTLCRSHGIPRPEQKKSPAAILDKQRQRNLKAKRLNGGKKAYHVIIKSEDEDL